MQTASRIFPSIGSFALAFMLLSGCATSETGRHQLLLMSTDEETQLGFTSFEQMKKDTPVSKDPKYNALVAKVGARIAEQTKDRLPNAKWEFVVFESDEANAFCLPGGKVGVYRGILPITQTEEGLAVVLGHEVAHASEQHGNERMSDSMVINGVANWTAGLASDKYKAVAQTAFGVGGQGVELKFSRTHESEADHVGLLYMARAGYNPEEALKFWDRFSAANKGQPEGLKWLRTHPLTADRIADLKTWMPVAKKEYKPVTR